MYKITFATPEQTSGIISFYRDVIKDMNQKGIYQWDENYPPDATFHENIQKGNLGVIYHDEKILGAIVLNEHREPAYELIDWLYEGKPLYLHLIAVCPKAQRKGIGRWMLLYAEHFARDRGYDVIRSDAFSTNQAALCFYTDNGYKGAGSIQLPLGEYYCFEKKLHLG